MLLGLLRLPTKDSNIISECLKGLLVQDLVEIASYHVVLSMYGLIMYNIVLSASSLQAVVD